MTIKLDDLGLVSFAKNVLADIDAAAVKLYEDGPRSHLGASQIGEPCLRKLWYGFRWVKYVQHKPQTLRLFNRGHREEARFNEWLREAGYRVFEFDPATGKQWRVSGVEGHFGGSCDGICELPIRYEVGSTRFLLEYKTNGTGAGFTKLRDTGVAIAKPLHYDQQCTYGYKLGIEYSIYLNVNKNDDSIHCEVIKLDHKRGAELEKKASIVIAALEPPDRIAQQPTHSECKWCEMRGPCWEGIPFDRNCRSCKNSRPVTDAQWYCEQWKAIIPKTEIPKGCPVWEPAL